MNQQEPVYAMIDMLLRVGGLSLIDSVIHGFVYGVVALAVGLILQWERR